jgi:hypothetical protein
MGILRVRESKGLRIAAAVTLMSMFSVVPSVFANEITDAQIDKMIKGCEGRGGSSLLCSCAPAMLKEKYNFTDEEIVKFGAPHFKPKSQEEMERKMAYSSSANSVAMICSSEEMDRQRAARSVR